MRGPASEVLLVLLLVLAGGEAAGDGSEGAQDEETGDQPAISDTVSPHSSLEAGSSQSHQSQAPNDGLSGEEVGGDGVRQVRQAVPALQRVVPVCGHQVGVTVDQLASVVDTPAQAGVLQRPN